MSGLVAVCSCWAFFRVSFEHFVHLGHFFSDSFGFLACGSAAQRAGRIWLATSDYSALGVRGGPHAP